MRKKDTVTRSMGWRSFKIKWPTRFWDIINLNAAWPRGWKWKFTRTSELVKWTINHFESLCFFSSGKQWNFTEAYAIINSIEQRLGARPSHKDFIPLLHDIKRQLFNFETTVVSRKDNVLKPHSITETKARNREFIEGEQTMYNEEGVDTFKGQKVIHVDDNVEGNRALKQGRRRRQWKRPWNNEFPFFQT